MPKDHKHEDAETEALHKKVAEELAEHFEGFVLYTPVGVIVGGSPLEVASAYEHGEQHIGDIMADLAPMAAAQLMHRLLGKEPDDCGDPTCKGHDKERAKAGK